MPLVPALIGAAATIGGGLLSSGASKSGAKTAAAAQTAAADKGIAFQQGQADRTDAELSPFRSFGTSALGPMGDLLGLNGDDAAGTAIQGLKNSPLYAALFGNAQNTVLANASATGGLRGGDAIHSLAGVGRDTLAQVIETQLGHLSGAASLGENAAATSGTFGAHSADAITQLLGEQGSAAAGSALAAGKANVGAIGDIGGALAALANNKSVQTAVGKLF